MEMLIDTALLKFRISIHQNRIVKKKKKEELPCQDLFHQCAGALGLMPGQELGSHDAATNTQCSQINKYE